MKYRIITEKRYNKKEIFPYAQLRYVVQEWVWYYPFWDYNNSFDSFDEAEKYISVMKEIDTYKSEIKRLI